MSFDPKQKGYRIGAEEAGTLVSPESYEDVAGTLKGQRGKGGGGIGPEETLVAGPLATGQTPEGHGMAGVNDQAAASNHIVPALTTRAGNTQDDQQTGQLVAVPISGDALRGEGEAKTPSPDAEGNVRLRDPGLGVGEEGDPAFTVSASSPGAVAAPLSHGSNPNSNAAGRRREDDENLVLAFETRYVRNGRGAPDTVVPPLKAQSGQTGKGDGAPMVARVVSPTIGADIGASAGGHPGVEEYAAAVHEASASVRRLTPRECERLQALPDDWTRIAENTPDSRRYAGLGDAVTASVGRWIGERIIAAELGAG